MALLAKRVRALDPATRMASASAMPSARDACSTWSKMAWHRAGSIGIGASDLDAAEARRTGAVAGAHDLLRLPLAAVGRAPQHPVRAALGDVLMDGVVGEAREGAGPGHQDGLGVRDAQRARRVQHLVENGLASRGFNRHRRLRS